ncbi:MAG: L,D-transpeptidase family protein [Campylobacterota bacterium]|nr:L,D-transpeptidase family protein [Campylobacterota bacterium]
MLKLILPLLLLESLYSTNIDIDKLRYEFTKDVVETNIFRKRYNKYINSNCKDNFKCFQKKINYLKQWKSVQNDEKLWSYYKKKSKLFTAEDSYWEKIASKLNKQNLKLKQTQFVSIIDLENQLFIISLYNHNNNKYYFIGKDYISSGNIKREGEVKLGEDHYLKTPSGVFKTQVGWRSNGKYNEDNKTLGYGYKNRYIFYFGKHKTIRYNTFDDNKNKIYDINKWKLITDDLDFALHAHKSTKPMGEAYSHGCVRTTDELNRFLDKNAILHKNMFNGKRWLHKYSKEPEETKYHDIAGEYLIVFDKI